VVFWKGRQNAEGLLTKSPVEVRPGRRFQIGNGAYRFGTAAIASDGRTRTKPPFSVARVGDLVSEESHGVPMNRICNALRDNHHLPDEAPQVGHMTVCNNFELLEGIDRRKYERSAAAELEAENKGQELVTGTTVGECEDASAPPRRNSGLPH
jgi:hypothetical protein